jgi:phosphate transport system substrate-binding protein
VKSAKRTFFILTLALAGCRGQVVPANPTPVTASIRLLAEESTAPLLRGLAAAYKPANTLVAWQIQTGEWQNVSAWLRDRRAPYALTSFLPPDSQLWSTPIGQEGLAVVVNTANSIANLTPAQLRAIFTGRALNWRELGGADLPIQVVTRPPGSAESAAFDLLIMGERRVIGASQLATTPRRLAELVAATDGAVGILPMRYLGMEKVRPVAIDNVLPTFETVQANQYPLRMPLLIVGEHAPAANDPYWSFFAWIQSPAGQAVVNRAFDAQPN